MKPETPQVKKKINSEVLTEAVNQQMQHLHSIYRNDTALVIQGLFINLLLIVDEQKGVKSVKALVEDTVKAYEKSKEANKEKKKGAKKAETKE